MMARTTMMAALMVAVALAGCTDSPGKASGCDAHAQRHHPDNPVVVLSTNLGDIEAELYGHMVPITVQNFLDLAPQFVDVPFHRIITDFMMQGGDLSRAPGGGTADVIPDEFHWMLKHDCKGQFSMANAGRGTGSSQFFVTFGPTPHLDDRHTVFGQVIGGMDVLDKVNNQAGSPSGTPATDVTLLNVQIKSGAVPDVTTGEVELFTFVEEVALPANGGKTGGLVVVENLGNERITVSLGAAGAGHDATAEPALFELPARQRQTVVVNSLAEAGAGALQITATSGSHSDSASLAMDVGGARGDAPAEGTDVTVDYIGATWDGRLFDTSIRGAAQTANDKDLWFDLFQARGANQYGPATFPYGGTIPGFTDLVGSLSEGEEGASMFGIEEAYGYRGCTPGQPCTGGLPMAFQAHLIEVS